MNCPLQKSMPSLGGHFTRSNFILKSIVICMLLAFGGCNIVYKTDVQQGNDVTTQMVAKLEIGMSKREVILIAGSPLITDPFHKDRWDYYYSKRNGKTGETVQHTASLKFTDDLLSEITSSFSDADANPSINPSR